MDCVNLKQQFGKRYRVTYEESYHADYGSNAFRQDPWFMVLLCRNGHICPWGGDLLAACTKSAGTIAKRLKALDFATIAQDGTDGVNVVFALDRFGEVAEIMQPRRRRRLSPKNRRAAAERLAKYQYRSAVGSPQNDRTAVSSAGVV